MPKASEVVSNSVKLVSLPDVYFVVKSLLEDPAVELGDVADALSTDPALTARCLRLVNSAIFGLRVRVETISRAVSLLGTTQIHDLVLANSVTSAFSGMPVSDMFSMQRFWETSLKRAVTAQCVAKRCNVLDPERLFVAGLLSDIGQLVLHCQEPALTAQAVLQASATRQPLDEVERAVIGCDLAQIGSSLMHEWRLPPTLVEATRFQYEPEDANDHPLEAAIVHIAAMMVGRAEQRAEDWRIDVHSFAWHITGLDATVVESMDKEISDRLADAASLIAPAGQQARALNPSVVS